MNRYFKLIFKSNPKVMWILQYNADGKAIQAIRQDTQENRNIRDIVDIKTILLWMAWRDTHWDIKELTKEEFFVECI